MTYKCCVSDTIIKRKMKKDNIVVKKTQFIVKIYE